MIYSYVGGKDCNGPIADLIEVCNGLKEDTRGCMNVIASGKIGIKEAVAKINRDKLRLQEDRDASIRDSAADFGIGID